MSLVGILRLRPPSLALRRAAAVFFFERMEPSATAALFFIMIVLMNNVPSIIRALGMCKRLNGCALLLCMCQCPEWCSRIAVRLPFKLYVYVTDRDTDGRHIGRERSEVFNIGVCSCPCIVPALISRPEAATDGVRKQQG